MSNGTRKLMDAWSKTFLVSALTFLLAGCGASQTTTPVTVQTFSPSATAAPTNPQQHDAILYLRAHSNDTVQIATMIDVVELDIRHKADLNQLAQDAQQAHDQIDTIRQTFAALPADPPLGDAQAELYGAMDELKNAMGALVAWTGDPNPATLAHFSSQYGMARGEWNDAVGKVWRIADRHGPPTI